jgi:hypothetical protein
MLSIRRTCETCGASLGATFPVYDGELSPIVTFRHLVDGRHEPEITGGGVAARARRSGHVIGATTRRLDA